ncbi:hypothetical protein G9A89_010361 [Geosiphon pyriformis]|nr:hypothetical protein G9A89_010361 [Geosiphon pyriformis]
MNYRNYKVHDATTNLLTTSISNSSISITGHLSTTVTNNLSAVPVNLLNTPNSNTATKLILKWNPKTENDTTKLKIDDSSTSTNFQFIKSTIRIMPAEFRSWNYLSLLVTPEDAASSEQKTNQKPLTSNIPLATSTKNKSLVAIFPFELEEITLVPLFSRATLDTKPITTMYTDAKVNGQYIKLILDSESAGSIITKQLMDQLGHRVDRAASARIITANRATKTPIGEIDNFPFEVNGITVLIKVLVIEATQYQALIGNNWLTKTNAILDWMTQELALSKNTMCGHFKMTTTTTPLIEFKEKKEKPIWEAYQVLWANKDHNKLLPILLWHDQEKKKQKEIKLTWNTNNNWEINENQKKIKNWEWEENKNGKGKGRKVTTHSHLCSIYPLITTTNQLLSTKACMH